MGLEALHQRGCVASDSIDRALFPDSESGQPRLAHIAARIPGIQRMDVRAVAADGNARTSSDVGTAERIELKAEHDFESC